MRSGQQACTAPPALHVLHRLINCALGTCWRAYDIEHALGEAARHTCIARAYDGSVRQSKAAGFTLSASGFITDFAVNKGWSMYQAGTLVLLNAVQISSVLLTLMERYPTGVAEADKQSDQAERTVKSRGYRRGRIAKITDESRCGIGCLTAKHQRCRSSCRVDSMRDGYFRHMAHRDICPGQ